MEDGGRGWNRVEQSGRDWVSIRLRRSPTEEERRRERKNDLE